MRGLAAIHVGTTGRRATSARWPRGSRPRSRGAGGRSGTAREVTRDRPPPAAGVGGADARTGAVRAGAGAGQLRGAALRPGRPARGRRPGHADRALPRGVLRAGAGPRAGARPGLPGARPGVPVPRRPSHPGHRRRRPRRARTRCPALAREGYGWRTVVRPRELADTLAWPGSWRIARRHWRYGAGELRRSLSKRAFTAAVRRLLPAVTRGRPACRPPAGVRAQAVLRDGTLVDDFLIREAPRTVHVLNAPSPAATASLPDRPRGGPPGAGVRWALRDAGGSRRGRRIGALCLTSLNPAPAEPHESHDLRAAACRVGSAGCAEAAALPRRARRRSGRVALRAPDPQLPAAPQPGHAPARRTRCSGCGRSGAWTSTGSASSTSPSCSATGCPSCWRSASAWARPPRRWPPTTRAPASSPSTCTPPARATCSASPTGTA